MPPNHFESEVESFLEGSHGDRTHIKRADHHTVTPLCGTLLHNQLGADANRVEREFPFSAIDWGIGDNRPPVGINGEA